MTTKHDHDQDGGDVAQSTNGTDCEEMLRTVRTRCDKVLRFDGYDENGPITWFVAYRGNFGWSACRGTGEWTDEPEEEEVKWAFDEYDHVQLVDRSETPDEVAL